MSDTKSVCIIYGFGEGSWHGRKFRQELIQNGFSIETNPEVSDIIISHSAGVFYLPATKPNQLIILIDPPFWPGKSRIISMAEKVFLDVRYLIKNRLYSYLICKTAVNMFYIITKPWKVYRIFRNSGRHNFYLTVQDREAVIVRNNDDVWLVPTVVKILEGKAKFSYFELPGEHDDCWLHPTAYIKVLKSIV